MGTRGVLRLALASSFWLGAWPQPGWEHYYLPQAALLLGVVVDGSDAPLSGVSIHDLEEDGYPRAPLEVGTDGRFDVSTKAPVVVFRKPGFESEIVRVSGGQPLRIVMRNAVGKMPACTAQTDCASIHRLCLPKLPGFRFGKPGWSIDATPQSISAPRFLRNGEELSHMLGGAWTARPRPSTVWASVEYSERQKQAGLLFFTDARGKTPAGKLWRRVGIDYDESLGPDSDHLGESVSYDGLGPAAAAVFDRLLDAACVKSSAKP